MLVISRRPGQTIHVGAVTIAVIRRKGGTILIGIDAPKETPIVRGELVDSATNVTPDNSCDADAAP